MKESLIRFTNTFLRSFAAFFHKATIALNKLPWLQNFCVFHPKLKNVLTKDFKMVCRKLGEFAPRIFKTRLDQTSKSIGLNYTHF